MTIGKRLDKLIPLDIFGPRISLTFNGRTSFKTTTGAILSVIALTAVLAYAMQTLAQVYVADIASTSVEELYETTYFSEVLELANQDFQIGVGLLGEEIPIEIASLKLEHKKITYVQNGENYDRVKEYTEIPMISCVEKFADWLDLVREKRKDTDLGTAERLLAGFRTLQCPEDLVLPV